MFDRRHERHQAGDASVDEGISQAAREGRHEDLAAGLRREVLGQPAEQDAGVGADAGFGVDLSLSEVAQQLIVQQALG